jgi:uncharacterized membrane protein
MQRLLGSLIVLLSLLPATVSAQTLVQDTVTMQLARVVATSDEKIETIPGTQTQTQTQTLTVEVLEGPETGKTVTFRNDYIIQLKTGDTFYLRHATNEFDETDLYAVSDPYRIPTLLILTVLFIALICVFGGLQGVRGFASLVGSIVLIFFVLIPGILQGYSPILVATGVAGVIIILGSYITHGFNKTTTAAVFGMLITFVITALLAFWTTHAAHLSGFSEESMYLNFDTRGSIDLIGLLFGGIMIGLLGVLYDIAIGQAITVEELFHVGQHLTRGEVFKRGIRIGREHIGALVNTLAIAYVGASLPLLLLVQSSTYGIAYMLNSEIFATEIIRILIGSIGLVLAVPVTTYIASRMLSAESAHTGHAHQH